MPKQEFSNETNEDFTRGELKFAYWYFTHKKLLKTILIVFLVILNLAIWGNNIYHFFLYKEEGKIHDLMLKELTKEKIDFLGYRQRTAPQELNIILQTVIKREKNCDFVAQIQNPNLNWTAFSFKYRFTWAGGETDFSDSFILPGEKKYLIAFGQKIQGTIDSFDLEIKDVKWKRLKRDEISLLGILSQIKAENAFLEEEPVPGLSKLSFTISNESIYNFWEVPLNIILYQGKTVVGADKLQIKRIRSQEKRSVEKLWPNAPYPVTAIYIEPELNIYNPKIFMPY